MPARVMLLLLAACGGEAGGEGGEKGATTGTNSAPEKEEKVAPVGYCLDTFQVGLADRSGHAMVQVCLLTDVETETYIRKHRKYHVGIKSNLERIVSANGLGELEMPGARARVEQEMLEAVGKQIEPLVVESLRIQRWELW